MSTVPSQASTPDRRGLRCAGALAALYVLFVGLVAFAGEVLGARVAPGVTVGLVLATAFLATTCLSALTACCRGRRR
jgi:uncharacterized membrane protein (DUF485 family)